MFEEKQCKFGWRVFEIKISSNKISSKGLLPTTYIHHHSILMSSANIAKPLTVQGATRHLEKRSPKNKHMELVNKEHRVEGWNDGVTNLYLENVDISHSVYFTRSANSILTIPCKLNHVNAVNLDRCTLRLRNGAVSGVELTRLRDSRIILRGHVATLQIDLCEDLTIEFNSRQEAAVCVIVHASNAGSLKVTIKGEESVFLLPSLITGEQQATFLNDEGQWSHCATAAIKHRRGYLELTALK